ncbi:SAM-dependent methyltransferase [Periweissella cryptocerci]|uniref:SAM-dependent methyltransferase n=1 Tax=Periweissella cryptocerci TaxID=2506420 RepID=A0A4V1AIS5_9LACO|nr:SAM-dependent methyltransferase [Periweissella cryptocerci]QBO36525.1 SAM-dependent methyltransferase [Periweissella cryptocerci]
MNPKQLKKLKKQVKQSVVKPYIEQLQYFADLYSDYPQIKLLINNALQADRLISQKMAPQPLPPLLLPDDIQNTIFTKLAAIYPAGDAQGDLEWDKLSSGLPKLDKLLRDFRDYLSTTYGMWAYTNSSFLGDLSTYTAGGSVLELMAGNGYISAGLRARNPKQVVYATDDTSWKQENATGAQPVTHIEALDALAALEKYGATVTYIIMSWSPDGVTIDVDVLNTIRNQYPAATFIVIGEKNGATDSKEFWQTASLEEIPELNAHYHTFDLIDERVYLVK